MCTHSIMPLHAHVAAAQLDSVPANRGQYIVNASDPVAVGAGRNYKLQIIAAYVAKAAKDLGPGRRRIVSSTHQQNVCVASI